MQALRAKLPYLTWLVAIVAMLGSLYFSEVMKLPPCVLCWYQRIAMYPLVLIIPISIMAKDKNGPRYILPLASIGWVIAFYHVLLYYHFIPESYAPCTAGISCTIRLIEWFGFITIPLLSFTAFTLIIIGTLLYAKRGTSHE